MKTTRSMYIDIFVYVCAFMTISAQAQMYANNDRALVPYTKHQEPVYRQCPPIELARSFCMKHSASNVDVLYKFPTTPVVTCMTEICPAPHTVSSQKCLWHNFDFCTRYTDEILSVNFNKPNVCKSYINSLDCVTSMTRNCLQRMCHADKLNSISAHRPANAEIDTNAIDTCIQRGDVSSTGCMVMYSKRFIGIIR